MSTEQLPNPLIRMWQKRTESRCVELQSQRVHASQFRERSGPTTRAVAWSTNRRIETAEPFRFCERARRFAGEMGITARISRGYTSRIDKTRILALKGHRLRLIMGTKSVVPLRREILRALLPHLAEGKGGWLQRPNPCPA